MKCKICETEKNVKQVIRYNQQESKKNYISYLCLLCIAKIKAADNWNAWNAFSIPLSIKSGTYCQSCGGEHHPNGIFTRCSQTSIVIRYKCVICDKKSFGDPENYIRISGFWEEESICTDCFKNRTDESVKVILRYKEEQQSKYKIETYLKEAE